MTQYLHQETDAEIDELVEGLTSLDAWVRGWRPTPGIEWKEDLKLFWRKYRRELFPEGVWDSKS